MGVSGARLTLLLGSLLLCAFIPHVVPMEVEGDVFRRTSDPHSRVLAYKDAWQVVGSRRPLASQSDDGEESNFFGDELEQDPTEVDNDGEAVVLPGLARRLLARTHVNARKRDAMRDMDAEAIYDLAGAEDDSEDSSQSLSDYDDNVDMMADLLHKRYNSLAKTVGMEIDEPRLSDSAGDLVKASGASIDSERNRNHKEADSSSNLFDEIERRMVGRRQRRNHRMRTPMRNVKREGKYEKRAGGVELGLVPGREDVITKRRRHLLRGGDETSVEPSHLTGLRRLLEKGLDITGNAGSAMLRWGGEQMGGEMDGDFWSADWGADDYVLPVEQTVGGRKLLRPLAALERLRSLGVKLGLVGWRPDVSTRLPRRVARMRMHLYGEEGESPELVKAFAELLDDFE